MRTFYTHQNLCALVRYDSQVSDNGLDYTIVCDTDISAI